MSPTFKNWRPPRLTDVRRFDPNGVFLNSHLIPLFK
jgi:hypothetical protein